MLSIRARPQIVARVPRSKPLYHLIPNTLNSSPTAHSFHDRDLEPLDKDTQTMQESPEMIHVSTASRPLMASSYFLRKALVRRGPPPRFAGLIVLNTFAGWRQ
jgi:hypothetical protein